MIFLNLPFSKRKLYKENGEVRYYINNGRGKGGTGEIDFISKDMVVEVKYKGLLEDDDCRNLLELKKRGVRKRVIVTGKECNAPGDLVVIPLWKLAAEGFGD